MELTQGTILTSLNICNMWPLLALADRFGFSYFFSLIVSSTQGAAFGFHMIAAKAGEQLSPFLPQLVPRLYRYQFDPNLSIRQAMTSIWDALVTDKTLVWLSILSFKSGLLFNQRK